ncbi:MAG: glycosyltransferase family 4 protein [Bacteroidota bacterium]
MHIAVLSDPANFHTQKWVKALLDAGVRVTVFSFFDYQIPGVACVKIEPGYTLRGRLTYGSYLYTTDALKKALVEHKVDLVNPINITPFGVWASRAGVGPIVSIAMGADILEYAPTDDQRIPPDRSWNSNNLGKTRMLNKAVYELKWRRFRKHVKHALETSDMIIGDNLELIKAMKNWFAIPQGKLRLNRWGIEEELFELSPKQEGDLRKKFQIRDWQRVIVSPRGLKPVYQGDLVLEAFERLLRRGVRDAKLIMLSAGYDVPQELDKKARELDQQFDNFYYESDLLKREEMCQLWMLADAIISVPVYDGYSNSLSEARYAGAIPIVNNIPAHREILTHDEHGWMVDPLSPEHLADAILEIMVNMDERKARYASKNRPWILEHAHLANNIRQFVEACKRILQKQKPS